MNLVAAHIIKKCGGPRVVAEILRINLSQVYRFTYPRERGGTDGFIPAGHHQSLLDGAIARGIALEPGDFFADASQDKTHEGGTAAHVTDAGQGNHPIASVDQSASPGVASVSSPAVIPPPQPSPASGRGGREASGGGNAAADGAGDGAPDGSNEKVGT